MESLSRTSLSRLVAPRGLQRRWRRHQTCCHAHRSCHNHVSHQLHIFAVGSLAPRAPTQQTSCWLASCGAGAARSPAAALRAVTSAEALSGAEALSDAQLPPAMTPGPCAGPPPCDAPRLKLVQVVFKLFETATAHHHHHVLSLNGAVPGDDDPGEMGFIRKHGSNAAASSRCTLQPLATSRAFTCEFGTAFSNMTAVAQAIAGCNSDAIAQATGE